MIQSNSKRKWQTVIRRLDIRSKGISQKLEVLVAVPAFLHLWTQVPSYATQGGSCTGSKSRSCAPHLPPPPGPCVFTGRGASTQRDASSQFTLKSCLRPREKQLLSENVLQGTSLSGKRMQSTDTRGSVTSYSFLSFEQQQQSQL